MSGDLKSLLGPSAQHYAWCGLAAQGADWLSIAAALDRGLHP
jgi:hypothetical protein